MWIVLSLSRPQKLNKTLYGWQRNYYDYGSNQNMSSYSFFACKRVENIYSVVIFCTVSTSMYIGANRSAEDLEIERSKYYSQYTQLIIEKKKKERKKIEHETRKWDTTREIRIDDMHLARRCARTRIIAIAYELNVLNEWIELKWWYGRHVWYNEIVGIEQMDERRDGSHSDKKISNDLLKLMETSDKLNEVNFTWKVLFELNVFFSFVYC